MQRSRQRRRSLSFIALTLAVTLSLVGCESAGQAQVSEIDADGPAVTAEPGPREGGSSPAPLRGDDRHADPWSARSYAGTTPAKGLPAGVEWLNSEYPLTLEQLEGKIVLVDFWTYGCINCIHNIPRLIELQEKYADSLVVIGVHSAKFANEGRSENLRRTISRYDIPYPVVNDADRRIMDAWNVHAWPTMFLIDPAGNVAGRETGEGFYDKFNRAILSLIREFEDRGELDRGPVDFTPDRGGLPQTVLSFPAKVLGDLDRDRIFVSDTSKHRVLEVDATDGAVRRVFGSGAPGFRDGDAGEAQFRKPRGLALTPDGGTLYVADTANHSLREIDLAGEEVTTLLGTGIKAYNYPPRPGPLPDRALRSPWDLALRDELLYVAMAGSHQIWQINLETRMADFAAGTGREAVIDGPAFESRLAQPSGLTIRGDQLYFADSESSFIRRLSLPEDAAAHGDAGSDGRRVAFEGRVETLTGSGTGLFEYGDVDGRAAEVRLQHPLGMATDGEAVYIADSYNHKIKRLDPESREVRTLFGGESGWADGRDAQFFEPGGIDIDGGTLLVADTNNHAIRLIDLETGLTETLVVHSVPRSPREIATVQLPPARVQPGSRELSVEISLPEGFKVNDDAPSGVTLTELPGFLRTEEREVRSPGQPFPVRLPVEARAGSGSLRVRLSLVYCREEEEGICFFETVDLVAPVEVTPGAAGETRIRLAHRVEHPEL